MPALGGDLKFANAEVAECQLKMCRSAAESGKLFVLADFDRTVTRCFLPDGSRGCSAHGVLEQNKLFSDAFTAKTKEYFDKYYPIEIDAKMTIAEKIPLMNEWYGSVHALLLQENITKSNIAEAVAACRSIQLREGIVELLRICQEATPPIPFLVMSAGLGDVIEEILRQRLPFAMAPSTMVVSNRMQFNEEGRLVGFSDPLLHMFNKTAAFFPEATSQLVSGYECCLLLGDGIGDVTMAEGLAVQELKVGFLNEKVDERLPKYLESFHIVVTGDAPVPAACFQALGRGRP